MKQPEYKILNTKAKKIIVPDRARVFILDYVNRAGADSTRSLVIGRGARVQYLFILDPETPAAFKISRHIEAADRAQVESYQLYLGRGDYEVAIDNQLGSEVSFLSRSLFWQKKRQILKIQDNYIFAAPATTAKFQATGLIDDAASAQYYADLIIKPAAQKTDSRIDMRLYLLSPAARGRLLPGLKIAANDVKAGHSASTFHLAPEDLFYLQTRGLSSEQIKTLVVNSVAGLFAAGIRSAAAQTLLQKLFKKRSA